MDTFTHLLNSVDATGLSHGIDQDWGPGGVEGEGGTRHLHPLDTLYKRERKSFCIVFPLVCIDPTPWFSSTNAGLALWTSSWNHSRAHRRLHRQTSQDDFRRPDRFLFPHTALDSQPHCYGLHSMSHCICLGYTPFHFSHHRSGPSHLLNSGHSHHRSGPSHLLNSGHRGLPRCSKQSFLFCAVWLVTCPKSLGQEIILYYCTVCKHCSLLPLTHDKHRFKLGDLNRKCLWLFLFLPGHCWTASSQGLHRGGNLSYFSSRVLESTTLWISISPPGPCGNEWVIAVTQGAGCQKACSVLSSYIKWVDREDGPHKTELSYIGCQ